MSDEGTFALMRSLLLLLALVVFVGSSTAFEGLSEPSTGGVSDTVVQDPAITHSETTAPWEASANTKAPQPATLKDEHSNAALYGWLFACVAALGMTTFVWRTIKKA